MNRRTIAAAIAVPIAAAGIVLSAPSSHAACGATEGTVPGSGPNTYSFGGQLYVDDRGGFVDLDGNGGAGGLWIYRETNGTPGLQRGGDPQGYTVIADTGLLPRVSPTPIPVIGGTLFPNGMPRNGATWSEELGVRDRCVQSTKPDTLLA